MAVSAGLGHCGHRLNARFVCAKALLKAAYTHMRHYISEPCLYLSYVDDGDGVQLGGKKGLGAQKVVANFSDVETAAIQRDKDQAQAAASLSSSQPTMAKSTTERPTSVLRNWTSHTIFSQAIKSKCICFGAHVIRSVLPAGSRRPLARYDWLACGTSLRNAQTCMICQLITIADRFFFFFFGTGSSVKGLGLGLSASESFIAHCRHGIAGDRLPVGENLYLWFCVYEHWTN